MTRKLSAMCVSVLGLALAGCPAVEEPWIKVLLGTEIVSDSTLEVSHGESLTFEAIDRSVEEVTWVLEEGQYRGEFPGRWYTNTFTNTSGHPITYRLTAFGRCFDKRVVSSSVWIKVLPTGGSGTQTTIRFRDRVAIFIPGAVLRPDGSFEVSLGSFELDCSGMIEGDPDQIIWLEGSQPIGTGRKIVLVCDRAGRRQIIIRLIDRRLVAPIEKVIVIVVVVTPVDDPGDPSQQWVDLKARPSYSTEFTPGPIYVQPEQPGGNVSVSLKWEAGPEIDRLEGTGGSGAWAGQKTLPVGEQSISLGSGTQTQVYTFVLTGFRKGKSVSVKSIDVHVQPRAAPEQPTKEPVIYLEVNEQGGPLYLKALAGGYIDVLVSWGSANLPGDKPLVALYAWTGDKAQSGVDNFVTLGLGENVLRLESKAKGPDGQPLAFDEVVVHVQP